MTLAQLLDPMVEAKYILTPVLWKYLLSISKKHQARGNGFGYRIVYPNNQQSVTRTLSARYYKDGAEILIDRGWDMATGEKDFDDPLNQQHRPRRLTPRECARLMGFEAPGEAKFRIPVSDTQAYRQFGNSVVVPVFAAVAKLLEPKIKQGGGVASARGTTWPTFTIRPLAAKICARLPRVIRRLRSALSRSVVTDGHRISAFRTPVCPDVRFCR